MSFLDKTLRCKECGADFVFTAGEQEFYHLKGLLHEPQRCPVCRAVRRQQRTSNARPMYTIICAACGQEAQVPFSPKDDRPVYCSPCYEKVRAQQ